MMPTKEIVAVAATSGESMETAGRASTSEPDNHDEIAALAYGFWLERGTPIGSPEEDWFRAEEELKNCKAKVLAATA